MFGDEATLAFRARWLESVFRHAEFIRRNFSLYSSANNHLIGEAAGLFIAAQTWPHWPQAETWSSTAREILEREVMLQNADDGVNREQAIAYQQFEIDLLLLASQATAHRQPFSGHYLSHVERMLEFIASVIDAGGNVPMIGDADDGVAVRWSPESFEHRYRASLAAGAIVFEREDFKAKAGPLDDASRWLFGDDGVRRYAALGIPQPLAAALPVRREFPQGGYYILGCDFESIGEIRLIADAGPLGYREIAAHGHADALSFTLSVGGTEYFVDPGTFAYHTQEDWRRYFRGTGAHNTATSCGCARRMQRAPNGPPAPTATCSKGRMTAIGGSPIRCCTHAASCSTRRRDASRSRTVW